MLGFYLKYYGMVDKKLKKKLGLWFNWLDISFLGFIVSFLYDDIFFNIYIFVFGDGIRIIR